MGMITVITAHFQKIAATVWYATAENQQNLRAAPYDIAELLDTEQILEDMDNGEE